MLLAQLVPWPAALLALLALQDHPGWSHEPPRATQDRLKIPQERPKIAQERPKSLQERPKTTPRGPKIAQERPKSLQERRKTTPRGPKSGPKAPKSDPGRPGSAKIVVFPFVFFNVFWKSVFCIQDHWKIDFGAPRSRQERPRAPQERPRSPQERPRSPQERP